MSSFMSMFDNAFYKSWPYIRRIESQKEMERGLLYIFHDSDRDQKDYDCFYASVFEREDPRLRHLPLAVQQKQIIVTCNYEARRRGLHKLQLIRDAKKQCPDVVIVLGEDLTRFRDASKELYKFLRNFSWSGKVERLGFDEVFMDVTDLIDYNLALINRNNLTTCFFHLNQSDPTLGFEFDASCPCGKVYPATSPSPISLPDLNKASPGHEYSTTISLRLVLGSYLARHLRHQLEEQKGYTATAGISINKLLSKLVGSVNKPNDQTTLLSGSSCHGPELETNVTRFIDSHEIGMIPGIGCKIAWKIRDHMSRRPTALNASVVYGAVKEAISVRDLRLKCHMGPALLEELIGGPGSHKNIGCKIWALMHGVDDSEVLKAKDLPQQISIEDSYLRLDNMRDVKKELLVLTGNLLRRMRIDLTRRTEETGEGSVLSPEIASVRQWAGRPRTLRLTTRPRTRLNPDGSRSRSFTRISKSCNMPSVAFSSVSSIKATAEKIVHDSLIPLFHRLHPKTSNWDLSLINVCATNISQLASNDYDGVGRDISSAFKKQVNGKEWKVEDGAVPNDLKSQQIGDMDPDTASPLLGTDSLEEAFLRERKGHQSFTLGGPVDEDASNMQERLAGLGKVCETCGAYVPPFVILAHERYHIMLD